MLERYAHLVPEMVADCLASESVQLEPPNRPAVQPPLSLAFRKELSDAHVEGFGQAHELRRAVVKYHRGAEALRAGKPADKGSGGVPPFVLLDELESSARYKCAIAAVERVIDILAHLPRVRIHAPDDLVRRMAWSIGMSASIWPEGPEPTPGVPPPSPSGGPAPAAARVAVPELPRKRLRVGPPRRDVESQGDRTEKEPAIDGDEHPSASDAELRREVAEGQVDGDAVREASLEDAAAAEAPPESTH